MTNLNLPLLKNALSVANLRQEAINSNIANINTENYKVNQVEFESLLRKSARDGSSRDLTEVNPIVSKRTNTVVKENGNNVDLDMEMVNLAENALYYQALITQLNGQYSRLKTIIGS